MGLQACQGKTHMQQANTSTTVAAAQVASALYDRLSGDVAPPSKPGLASSELFVRDGNDAADADLAAALDAEQLACMLQGLQWLLSLLREPLLQVPAASIAN